MTAIPESSLALAGFTLAHAVWSVSDLEGEDLLCPLAFIERSAERELVRFEAETQAAAIAKGKQQLTEHASDADSWAFAHEGLINEDGAKVDVILVLLMSGRMTPSLKLIQRFKSFAKRNRFRLMGEPSVFLDGVEQADDVVEGILLAVRNGILEHTAVSMLWDSWSGW